MKWEKLESELQFRQLLEQEPVFAVFKHSTRCSISAMALNRLEREWDLDIPICYLDLLRFRPLSNLVAALSGIHHESPQLILFQHGKAIYHASHNAIRAAALREEGIS